MQPVVDLKSTRKTAFVRGFWKGMAAPVMLFSSSALPAEAQPIEYKPLERPPAPPASDWVRVGQGLRAALIEQRRTDG